MKVCKVAPSAKRANFNFGMYGGTSARREQLGTLVSRASSAEWICYHDDHREAQVTGHRHFKPIVADGWTDGWLYIDDMRITKTERHHDCLQLETLRPPLLER